MIRFVKNQKEEVSTILVYSLDRFSRTGDNAIFISSELKKRGIRILSVTQPIDVSTHAGTLQQNIQFIFSKYDNDLRRKHAPLISKDLFLQANNELSKTSQGYKVWMKNSDIPLKNFVKCFTCGTPLTGYIIKKNGLHYYKCNKPGCKCNRSARIMHERYVNFLSRYQVNPDSSRMAQDHLWSTYESMTASDRTLRNIITQRLGELAPKLESIEEKYAFGDLQADVFSRVSAKLKDEIRILQDDLRDCDNKLSNPVMLIKDCRKLCSNLVEYWVSADFDGKRSLQNLMFPEGLQYDRQIDDYRTNRVNTIIELTHSLSGYKEKRDASNFECASLSVVCTGIEPVLPE